MNAYPDTPLAWDRTRRMARRLGVDLPRAVFDGWLTRRDLDALVCACEDCGQASCRSEARPDLAAACANTADLEDLRL